MPHIDPLPRLREIRDAIRRAEALVPERDRLVRRAVKKNGYSQRRVAEAAGISQSRVDQIVKEK